MRMRLTCYYYHYSTNTTQCGTRVNKPSLGCGEGECLRDPDPRTEEAHPRADGRLRVVGFKLKCARIIYFPQKTPALKWPRNKEKRLKDICFLAHIKILHALCLTMPRWLGFCPRWMSGVAAGLYSQMF